MTRCSPLIGYKVEKQQGEAVISSKKNKDGRRVWLCSATVNVPPKVLWGKIKVGIKNISDFLNLFTYFTCNINIKICYITMYNVFTHYICK